MSQAQLWEAGRVVIKGRRGRKITCICGTCTKCRARDYGRDYYYGIRKGRPQPVERRSKRLDEGYAVILLHPDDPLFEMTGSKKSRGVLEHRLVMARHLGRPLTDDEHVHHRNGNRLDNRLENLELWTTHHPKGQRVEDLYAWALAFIEQYQPELG